jgi:C-terminal processing protease CtpA/Prc
LNKFSPKYNQQELSAKKIQSLNFEPDKEVHIKMTRRTEYGDRYKLFVIDKGSFDKDFNLENYGLVLSEKENKLIVKSLDWKGLAKKSGIEAGDIISNFKTENLERPNKAVIYPFAAFLLFVFGLLNYRRSQN